MHYAVCLNRECENTRHVLLRMTCGSIDPLPLSTHTHTLRLFSSSHTRTVGGSTDFLCMQTINACVCVCVQTKQNRAGKWRGVRSETSGDQVDTCSSAQLLSLTCAHNCQDADTRRGFLSGAQSRTKSTRSACMRPRILNLFVVEFRFFDSSLHLISNALACVRCT